MFDTRGDPASKRRQYGARQRRSHHQTRVLHLSLLACLHFLQLSTLFASFPKNTFPGREIKTKGKELLSSASTLSFLFSPLSLLPPCPFPRSLSSFDCYSTSDRLRLASAVAAVLIRPSFFFRLRHETDSWPPPGQTPSGSSPSPYHLSPLTSLLSRFTPSSLQSLASSLPVCGWSYPLPRLRIHTSSCLAALQHACDVIQP